MFRAHFLLGSFDGPDLTQNALKRRPVVEHGNMTDGGGPLLFAAGRRLEGFGREDHIIHWRVKGGVGYTGGDLYPFQLPDQACAIGQAFA